MKLPCNVIRDLLPLYKDNVCSGESGALVEEHLGECEVCRTELRLMQNDSIEQEIEEQGEKAFDSLKARVKKKNRRSLWTAVSAAVVLAAVLVSLFCYKNSIHTFKMREVTQIQAVTVMPTVIITGEEYALAGKLLQSEEVQEALASGKACVTLDETVNAQFIGQIHVEGEPVDTATISVVGSMVYFDYTAGDNRYIITFTSADHIVKSAAQYKRNKDIKYFFENDNNATYKEYYLVRDFFPDVE
jgi:hypothetical protein